MQTGNERGLTRYGAPMETFSIVECVGYRKDRLSFSPRLPPFVVLFVILRPGLPGSSDAVSCNPLRTTLRYASAGASSPVISITTL